MYIPLPSAPPITPPYETERLILRPFLESDFDAVHCYASDAEAVRLMLMDPNIEDVTRSFIRYASDVTVQPDTADLQLAVILKSTGVLIGGCGITSEGGFSEGNAEVGWLLNRAYWRQGYGTEIGSFLLRLGFMRLRCHRIFARCDAENVGSYGVMDKIGMRREGCFIEGRRGNSVLRGALRDELTYALLSDEWHAQREMEYINTLPVMFEDFIDLPPLTDGVVELSCVHKSPAEPEKQYVPAYHFEIRRSASQSNPGERVGQICLRIGYTNGLYYGGQIGYSVDEAHRGNGYAGRACKLLAPVIKAHGMQAVLITNNHTNRASQRVCEKLGAKLLRVARLPEWSDLYQAGQRFENIYIWEVV